MIIGRRGNITGFLGGRVSSDRSRHESSPCYNAGMGDPAFYRAVTTKRFAGMYAQLAADLEREGLPAHHAAEIVARFRASCEPVLNEQFEAGLWSKVEQSKFVDFLDQLLTRQGTQEVDFDELYSRRAKLEHRCKEPKD